MASFCLLVIINQSGTNDVYVYSKLLFRLLCLLYIKEGNDSLVLFVERVFS